MLVGNKRLASYPPRTINMAELEVIDEIVPEQAIFKNNRARQFAAQRHLPDPRHIGRAFRLRRRALRHVVIKDIDRSNHEDSFRRRARRIDMTAEYSLFMEHLLEFADIAFEGTLDI